MSDFADKLAQAIDKKENDINRWIWKSSNGKEVRMMDMTSDQIQLSYWHTIDMLENKDPYHPGVLKKKEQVARMWDCANAELLLRYILHSCNIEGIKTNKDLLDYITAHKNAHGIKNTDLVTTIFDGIPDIYSRIDIDTLISACLDTLPAFNKKLLTDKFILSLGIWLTEQEKKDLTEFDENGHYRNRKDIIKERLMLNPNAEIRFSSRGLTYAEFRSLLRIEGKPKFSSMTTDAITLLRDKVLLLLDQDLSYHVNKWQTLKEKLELIAQQKNMILKTEK